MTRLALAQCTEAEIATTTGHSLRSCRAILDTHYLSRDPALAESAIRKLESRRTARSCLLAACATTVIVWSEETRLPPRARAEKARGATNACKMDCFFTRSALSVPHPSQRRDHYRS